MKKLISISPRAYARLTMVMLVLLATIVATGALVRLTGSGLGCPDWPKCHGQIVAPADFNSQIEFGNRVFTGIIGVVAALVGLLAWFRKPYRRDLFCIGLIMPLGIAAEAALGALTVLFELRFGFVMAHFCLSIILLAAGVSLAWRSRHDLDRLPVRDRAATWVMAWLVSIASLLIFLGTVTTAAGPHPGSGGTGQQVQRLDFLGDGTLDTLIHWHGRIGTLLGISLLLAWIYLRRRGFKGETLKAIAIAAVLTAVQGIIGLIQYLNALPAPVVWIHILVATLIWISVVWAAVSVRSLAPTQSYLPSAS